MIKNQIKLEQINRNMFLNTTLYDILVCQ